MALFNHSTRELTAKIVYYGPALGGKTTNLRTLHAMLDHASRGKLLSLATAQDRTIYFDLLPVELGNIKGYTVRFQLCTVPGQVFYNETRKIVLRGVDGVVFVVDSQPAMLSHALESFQNLRENLREEKIALESLPVVIQYNKRDLPSSLSVAALQESLGFAAYPFVEAAATVGAGVVETFRLASKLTFVDLLRRLQKGEPGVTETAAAALVAATETTSAFASETPEPVFAVAEAALPEPRETAAVHARPEPPPMEEPVPVVAATGSETVSSAPAPAPPKVPSVMMFEGLGLEEDSEGWEATPDDTGPYFDDEPSLDSSLVTSEIPPVESDLASTRAIQVPVALPPLLPPEEPPPSAPEATVPEPEPSKAFGVSAPASETAGAMPAEAAAPPETLPPPEALSPAEMGPLADLAELSAAPAPPPPAPAEEAGREEAGARLNARLTALEEEIATLRSALAESRSREDSLQVRTEELGRRWEALRKLLSEDGPTVG